MRNDLFVTAVKNGQYVSIDIFKSGDGEKCGCICPDCGEKVRSNITSKSEDELKKTFTNHFSHVNENSTCTGGYKETELHLFAKEVLQKSSNMKVPSEKYHYPDTLYYTSVKLEPSFPIQAYKQFRPDIILTDRNGNQISIEIVVTNDLSPIKRQLYINNSVRCIRINLSSLYKKSLEESKTLVRSTVLENTEVKKWIWPEILNELDEKPRTPLQALSQPNSGCLLLFLTFIIMFVMAVSIWQEVVL